MHSFQRKRQISMIQARLILDSPNDASYNMALDQALLDSTSMSSIPCLRFYSWKSPTLTLGYFQKTESRKIHLESQSLPFVRRSTGGGAIIHHHEWTYSFTIPEKMLPGNENIRLYHLVHDSVVDFLRGLGLNASKYDRQNPMQISAEDSKAFLCFQRRTEGDVVIYSQDQTSPEFGNKILGSAQRKRNATILQHGSILIEKSAFAPQLPGIEDHMASLGNREGEFQRKIQSDIAKKLNLNFSSSQINEREKNGAENWLKKSFENEIWNNK